MRSFVRVAYPLANKPVYQDGDLRGKPGAAMKDAHMTPEQLAGYSAAKAHSAAMNAQFLQEHPSSAENVANIYRNASDDVKAQGRNWYPAANHVAHQIAADASSNTGRRITADQVAGLLAVYSPQTRWHDNMHQASLAAHGIFPGTGGTGWKSPFASPDGRNQGFMVTNAQAEQARRIMNGENWRDVLKGTKVSNFGQNIATGGIGELRKAEEQGEGDDGTVDRPAVTIDRHAVSNAHGTFADAGVYNATKVSGSSKRSKAAYNQYIDNFNNATDQINAEQGTHLLPTQMQATTWVAQQQMNGDDQGGVGEASKKTAAASVNRWNHYAAQMHPNDLVDKTPGVGFAGAGKVALQRGEDLVPVPTYHGMPSHAEGQPSQVTPPSGIPIQIPVDPREATARIPYVGLQQPTQPPAQQAVANRYAFVRRARPPFVRTFNA
jgi:hypothetical protein